ncbi:hypothetical protein H2198_006612 [Neophaeococcomyces mojaviensis]|uniref:Uncharacterized protein n=1 Tax=Neophaeococcomyces mojaviensis TaxID=3383035 RepID=A0ACC3A2R6_9EURO|nr:hypothetical protein H2198_006612 [Knufia sp. JES_112]
MSSLSQHNIKAQPLTPDISNIPSPARSTHPDTNQPSIEATNETPLAAPVYPDVSQFTFLPELYLIISRLAPIRNIPATTIASNPPDITANGTGPTPQPQTSDPATNNNSLTQTISRESQLSGSGSLRQLNSSEASIEIKDLPAHVYGIKQRIARAKESVSGLPDCGRSVEEQEAEMKELRRRVAGLRERLGELGGIAKLDG